MTFTFDVKGNRELPQIVGQLDVLSKKFWQGTGPDGQPRDLMKSTLEIPLGSGPYRIKSFDAGRTITYERVKDYWAKDLPVSKGQWNFDEFKLTYFLDRTPAFEEFKSGKLDYWIESTASQWATGYNFPAIEKGWVKKEAIPVKRVAPMQAFVFNQRRKQFQDPRVRRAFALAFNFEEANKKLFYDLYVRVGSYFDNSELASKGLPQGRELEILNEVKSEVPPEVFTTEWKNPVNATPEDFRNHMREASKLLAEAGWTVQEVPVEDGSCGTFCSIMRSVGLSSPPKANVLRNAQGETLERRVPGFATTNFEKIVLPYVQDLQKLGIKARVRMVDSAQYKRREDAHDYDIIIDNFAQSESPGNEQRDFWGSVAADRDGTRNTAGIKNPAIDKLIDKVVFAKDRDELLAATHALDRVLLWNFYVVPQWHYPYERVAYWDVFGRPAKLAIADIGAVAGVVVRRRQAEGARRRARTVMVAMHAVPPAPRAPMLTRLATLAIAAALLAAPSFAEPRYGLSAFGELKYPADFKNFEYVNPDAPKGGRLAMIGTAGRTTFDSFNNYILKGDAAQGLEYLFDSLMTRALDEPDAVYGLVASSAEVAPDKMSVVFKMRPEAKFADGTPVTADDVVFSFNTLKEKGHPNFMLSLRDVVKAEALDPHTVRYEFKGDLIRDLPLVVAELPILSKAFYTTHPFDSHRSRSRSAPAPT